MKVILIAALTADGFIGKHDADLSTRWTSKEDAQFFRSLSQQADAVVVGAKTFATFNKKLAGRKFFVFSRQTTIANPYENDLTLVNQDPREFLKNIEKNGNNLVLIAGGQSIYTLFLQAGLVDELYLTTEPVLFGAGVSLCNQPINTSVFLHEIITLSQQTKVSVYKVIKNN